MIIWFYTVYAWIVGVICTAIFGTIAIILSIFDSSGNVVHICGRLWGKTILRCIGIRVTVKGRENFLSRGPQILLSNHQGILDILVFEGFLPLQFRWIARKNLFDIPILGWSMRRAGYIPIVRKGVRKSIKSIQIAAEKVKQGAILLVFPEGTRSPDGKLGTFKKGSLIIILNSLAPTVPVLIDGSFKLLPKGTLKIRPGKITINVFPPLYPDQMSETERKDILNDVHSLFNKSLASGSPQEK